MSASFSSLTCAIPADQLHLCRWRIFVNGEEQLRVLHLVLDHPSFGTLTYGLTAGGHDGWSFHERGGGGSVILPFSMVDGELFVGLVEQQRPHQGGTVLNAPRGFVDPAERRDAAAQRELMEETGIDVPASALSALPGAPANPNSGFFETTGTDEGVHFFAVEIPAERLLGQGNRRMFAEGAVDKRAEVCRSKLAEQVGEVVFVPWYEAATLGDMFTNAAVARLLAARRRMRE